MTNAIMKLNIGDDSAYLRASVRLALFQKRTNRINSFAANRMSIDFNYPFYANEPIK